MNDHRADTFAELATWDPLELWGLADMSIFFDDDADADVRQSFRLRQDVARELTRYGQYREKMSAPLQHPIPEERDWVRCAGSHPTQVWLLKQHPGVAAYFRHDARTPPPFIWAHIERANLWRLVENTFLNLLEQKAVIPDWKWWEKAVRQRIVEEHLGVAPEADDLLALIWLEREKESEDKIELLNRSMRGAFGSVAD